jgi:hypothetical protein
MARTASGTATARVLQFPAQATAPVAPAPVAPVAPVAPPAGRFEASSMSRNDVIKAIKSALKARTGKSWSVRGGRGTGYGWLTIDAPKALRRWTSEQAGTDASGMPVYAERYLTDAEVAAGKAEYAHMGPATRRKLAELLGLERVQTGGVSIPSGSDFYQCYLDRARTGTSTVTPERYWD